MRQGSPPRGPQFPRLQAYALARDTGEPLLFKGNDFARTDIVAEYLPVPYRTTIV